MLKYENEPSGSNCNVSEGVLCEINMNSATLPTCIEETKDDDDQNVDAPDDAPICEESCTYFDKDQDENDLDEESAETTAALILLQLRNEIINKHEENVLKCENEPSGSNCNVSVGVKKITLMDLLKNDDDFKIFIGINHVLLNNLVKVVKLCEKKKHYQYIYSV